MNEAAKGQRFVRSLTQMREECRLFLRTGREVKLPKDAEKKRLV